MGHCLGLWHTHHGTYAYDGGGTPELVDGSNSSVAGDFIVDTPADPNIWDNGKFPGWFTDAKGMVYRPDPTLIMSYSFVGNRFTTMQINVMHENILNNDILQNATDCTPEINGSDIKHFNNTTEISIATPKNGFTATWDIKRYKPAPADDSPSVLEEKTVIGNNCILNSSTSDYYDIKVTYSKGIQSSTTRFEMTSNAPSPFTGTLIWDASNGCMGGTTNMNHGESLSISGNVTLQLGYMDRVAGIMNDVQYRCVTATNRVINGSSMSITTADCARGFLKIKTSNNTGNGDGYFTIPVTIIGGYYAMNVDTASGRITLSSEAGASPSGKTAAKAKAPAIGTIIIYDSTGKTVATLNGNAASTANISTAGWPKGEYRAEVSDGAGYNQTILFAL